MFYINWNTSVFGLLKYVFKTFTEYVISSFRLLEIGMCFNLLYPYHKYITFIACIPKFEITKKKKMFVLWLPQLKLKRNVRARARVYLCIYACVTRCACIKSNAQSLRAWVLQTPRAWERESEREFIRVLMTTIIILKIPRILKCFIWGKRPRNETKLYAETKVCVGRW